MLRFVFALPLVAAAADAVPGILARDRTPTDACATAVGVPQYCDLAVGDDTPDDVKANCYCCDDTEPLAPAYETCASYVSEDIASYRSVSMTLWVSGLTRDLASLATVQAMCNSASSAGFSCGVLSSPASSTALVPPPACTSMDLMVNRCRVKYRHPRIDELENCICYTDGVYNSRFDVYASECDHWYTSASPLDEDDYAQLTSFCASWASLSGSYTPATGSATTDAMSTASSSAPSTAPASSAPTATPATAPKTAAAPSTAASTAASTADSTATSTAASTATSAQSTSQAAATGGAALNRAVGSGFVAWLAVVLPAAML